MARILYDFRTTNKTLRAGSECSEGVPRLFCKAAAAPGVLSAQRAPQQCSCSTALVLARHHHLRARCTHTHKVLAAPSQRGRGWHTPCHCAKARRVQRPHVPPRNPVRGLSRRAGWGKQASAPSARWDRSLRTLGGRAGYRSTALALPWGLARQLCASCCSIARAPCTGGCTCAAGCMRLHRAQCARYCCTLPTQTRAARRAWAVLKLAERPAARSQSAGSTAWHVMARCDCRCREEAHGHRLRRQRRWQRCCTRPPRSGPQGFRGCGRFLRVRP